MNKKCHLLVILILVFINNISAEEQITVDSFGLVGPVQSVRESVSNYRNYNGDWIKQRSYDESHRFFDSQGRIIEETTYDTSGNKSNVLKYEYDQMGRIVYSEIEWYQYDGSLFSRIQTVTTYNNAGSRAQIEQISIDENGDEIGRTTNRFDELDRQIEQVTIDASGTTTEKWERQKTDDGEKIEYILRNSNSIITRRETTLLDQTGRITKMEQWFRGQPETRWTYTYGNNGGLELATYFRGRVSLELHYTYDEEGNTIRVVRESPDRKVQVEREFGYDSNNVLRSETARWYHEGVLSHTWHYQYDHNGNIIVEEVDNNLYEFSIRWSREYDDKNREIYNEMFDSLGYSFSSSRNSYDSRDSEVLNHQKTVGIDSGYRVENVYDRDDNIVKRTRFDTKGTPISIQTYEYTRQGDLLEWAELNTDESIRTRIEHTYEYDDQGNWIMKKTFNTNNVVEEYSAPREERGRLIIYY